MNYKHTKEELEYIKNTPIDVRGPIIEPMAKGVIPKSSAKELPATKAEFDALEAKCRQLASSNTQFEVSNTKLKEIVEAVAYIGIDFGFGNYVLEDKYIAKARELLEELGEA